MPLIREQPRFRPWGSTTPTAILFRGVRCAAKSISLHRSVGRARQSFQRRGRPVRPGPLLGATWSRDLTASVLRNSCGAPRRVCRVLVGPSPNEGWIDCARRHSLCLEWQRLSRLLESRGGTPGCARGLAVRLRIAAITAPRVSNMKRGFRELQDRGSNPSTLPPARVGARRPS